MSETPDTLATKALEEWVKGRSTLHQMIVDVIIAERAAADLRVERMRERCEATCSQVSIFSIDPAVKLASESCAHFINKLPLTDDAP